MEPNFEMNPCGAVIQGEKNREKIVTMPEKIVIIEVG
jgi:hypothetical protein